MGDRVDKMAFEALAFANADKTAVDLLGDVPRVTKDDVHNMLMVAGFTPGLGNVADAADAVLYASEGEFGAAGLSAAAMIPFIGQAVSAKRALKIAKESGEEMITMYRGVDQWYPGKMVKEGKFIGPGTTSLGTGGKAGDALRVTQQKELAERYAIGYSPKGPPGTGATLEFEVPLSYVKKNYIIGEIPIEGGLESWLKKGRSVGHFKEGLPKEFLIKVHK